MYIHPLVSVIMTFINICLAIFYFKWSRQMTITRKKTLEDLERGKEAYVKHFEKVVEDIKNASICTDCLEVKRKV
jgi:hypothetical protein